MTLVGTHCDFVGYELHITRAADWSQANEAPIEFEEWTEHAQSNGSLVEAGTYGTKTFPFEQTIFAVIDEHGGTIDWHAGQLTVTGSRDSDLDHLRSIAVALSARVQGDDGEFYSP